MNYHKRRIYLSEGSNVYCNCRLYNTWKEMQVGFMKYTDQKYDVWGCFVPSSPKINRSENFVGTVFLSLSVVGHPITAHEMMHTLIWGWEYSLNKEQYPFVIKNMQEEEKLLQSLTFTLTQLQRWVKEIKTNKQNKP